MGLERAPQRPVLLLVEDEPGLSDVTAELLERSGYSVVTAADGREALQMLRSGLRPSVILLDVMMPVMDGREFRHVQRADPDLRDIPVVVMSAAPFTTAIIRSQFGDVGFVRKPFGGAMDASLAVDDLLRLLAAKARPDG
jgi:CheY-like chemotaxis protein